MSEKMAFPFLKKLLFTLVAVALVWILLELVVLSDLWLRPSPADFKKKVLYGPHPYLGYAQVPNRTDQSGHRSINSLGLRGRDIAVAKPADTIRIVCLGGSTTFSDGATTDSRTWPARMERLLRDRYRNAPFRIEVINAGVNSYTSLESLIQFQTRLLDFSPDVAVFHHGRNECWFMLEFPGYQSDYSHARRTFSIPPPKFWEYSPLLSRYLARNSVANPYYPAQSADLGAFVITNPALASDTSQWLHGELTPEMIATFERNTRTFISVARANGVIPVLSTQSNQDDWATGGRWIRSVERMNQVTRDVAASESAGLIDFAQLLPWNPVDYYDYCHLRDSPGGLGRQAELFADGLVRMRALEQTWERRRATKAEVGGEK